MHPNSSNKHEHIIPAALRGDTLSIACWLHQCQKQQGTGFLSRFSRQLRNGIQALFGSSHPQDEASLNRALGMLEATQSDAPRTPGTFDDPEWFNPFERPPSQQEAHGAAFLLALAAGHLEMMHLLLPGTSPTLRQHALHFAARFGHTDAVRVLMPTHAIAEWGGLHPLKEAVEHGHAEIVQMLVSSGRLSAEVLSDALIGISASGHEKMLPMVLPRISAHKVLFTEKYARSLLLAATAGHDKIVALLVPEIPKKRIQAVLQQLTLEQQWNAASRVEAALLAHLSPAAALHPPARRARL